VKSSITVDVLSCQTDEHRPMPFRLNDVYLSLGPELMKEHLMDCISTARSHQELDGYLDVFADLCAVGLIHLSHYIIWGEWIEFYSRRLTIRATDTN